MARQRLSWSKEAETAKKADPYTMNQEHKDNPISKYDIGGPSQFAEDPDLKTPWKTEGRTETGHPAPAREAVKAARQLEDKALKCITIAQRMLPGASDDVIEEQATDLMYLPENSILSTLQRQASLAQILAGEKEEEEEEEEKKVAKKEEEEEEEEKKAAKKEEEEEEEEKKASDLDIDFSEEGADLLDSVFAKEEKAGAKKLSGIVKKASTDVELGNLWNAPPDVSEAFGLK